MFGISFSKVVILVAVVAIVWFGFKYLQRLQASAAAPRPAARRGSPAAATEREPAAATTLQTEDMVACRVCGTYVSAKAARPCGRADCIYGRR